MEKVLNNVYKTCEVGSQGEKQFPDGDKSTSLLVLQVVVFTTRRTGKSFKLERCDSISNNIPCQHFTFIGPGELAIGKGVDIKRKHLCTTNLLCVSNESVRLPRLSFFYF
jgi:hypothetical protein